MPYLRYDVPHIISRCGNAIGFLGIHAAMHPTSCALAAPRMMLHVLVLLLVGLGSGPPCLAGTTSTSSSTSTRCHCRCLAFQPPQYVIHVQRAPISLVPIHARVRRAEMITSALWQQQLDFSMRQRDRIPRHTCCNAPNLVCARCAADDATCTRTPASWSWLGSALSCRDDLDIVLDLDPLSL